MNTRAHTHTHTHTHTPGYGIRSALDVKSATACDSTALVPSMIVTGKTRTRGLSMFVGRIFILSYRQHFSSAHQYPFPGHVPRLAHTHTHTHTTHTHTPGSPSRVANDFIITGAPMLPQQLPSAVAALQWAGWPG